MSKSNGRMMFGSSHRGHTVTVIEAPIRYSQRRKAIVGFWVTWFTVGLLTSTVASHYLHPIVGGLLGLVTGAVLGAMLFALIIAWPVLRIIWWWLPELLLGLAITYGWTGLMTATPLWLSLLLVSVGLGVPAAFKQSRYWVLAPLYCLAVRHRLRTCFAAFIATNREGTLPLILAARPPPGRGTGVDLAAARPVDLRPGTRGPGQETRRRVLGQRGPGYPLSGYARMCPAAYG